MFQSIKATLSYNYHKFLHNKDQSIPHLDPACMRRREQRYEPQKTPGSTSFPAVKVDQNR